MVHANQFFDWHFVIFLPLLRCHQITTVKRQSNIIPCAPVAYIFNASVIDNQGRSCHQQIATVACRGLCESYESSDYRIPESVVLKYSKCDYEQFERRVTLLNNCDADIDPGVKLYHYKEAISCSCKSYTILTLLIVIKTTHSEKPQRCQVRQYNFTAVKQDSNGKQCRGMVSTYACYGTCNTSEIGTNEFPYSTWKSVVCTYVKKKRQTVELTNCDNDVEPMTKYYHYLEAENCKCRRCKRPNMSCNNIFT
ncbi:Glycoprotein hormone beta-5 [Trichinella pseudospiralis]|uniref:Glycoprotein hormone beta-5 n=1 Tax=Trichinella pseudospiralis TaxID=6337 RepID=A0A0V1FSR2_TRIPS|nr:Glycoprotein hormone beta-5 [Trichinella pseudospiralis]